MHGYGFLESVYRRALAVELRHRGIAVAEEVRYEVRHRGVAVGLYKADLVAESSVVLETKTGLSLDPVAPAQLLNYLRVSGLSVGLILHFGPRPIVKRLVVSGHGSDPELRPLKAQTQADADDAEMQRRGEVGGRSFGRSSASFTNQPQIGPREPIDDREQ